MFSVKNENEALLLTAKLMRLEEHMIPEKMSAEIRSRNY